MRHDPSTAKLMVLKGYFDASGSLETEECNAVVVGGFIGQATDWVLFKDLWEQMLARHGLDCFGAADIEAQLKKDLKEGRTDGWTVKRLHALQDDIVDVVARAKLRPVLTGLYHTDYQAVDELYEMHEKLARAYGMAAGTLMGSQRRRLGIMSAEAAKHFMVFFEKGDADQQDIAYLMGQDPLGQSPIFLRKRSPSLRGDQCFVRQFEAADFLAYEARKAKYLIDANAAMVGTGSKPKAYRHGGLALDKRFGRLAYGWVGQSELIEICKVSRVPLRAAPI